MLSNITGVITITITLLRTLPTILAWLKRGVLAVDEVQALIKWFFKHKQANPKATLFVVPEPAVNKAALKRAVKVSAVPVDTLKKLAETGGAPGPVEAELIKKYGGSPENVSK